MAGPRLCAERILRSVADVAEDSDPQRCHSQVDSIGSRSVIVPAGCDQHVFGPAHLHADGQVHVVRQRPSAHRTASGNAP